MWDFWRIEPLSNHSATTHGWCSQYLKPNSGAAILSGDQQLSGDQPLSDLLYAILKILRWILWCGESETIRIETLCFDFIGTLFKAALRRRSRWSRNYLRPGARIFLKNKYPGSGSVSNDKGPQHCLQYKFAIYRIIQRCAQDLVGGGVILVKDLPPPRSLAILRSLSAFDQLQLRVFFFGGAGSQLLFLAPAPIKSRLLGPIMIDRLTWGWLSSHEIKWGYNLSHDVTLVQMRPAKACGVTWGWLRSHGVKWGLGHMRLIIWGSVKSTEVTKGRLRSHEVVSFDCHSSQSLFISLLK